MSHQAETPRPMADYVEQFHPSCDDLRIVAEYHPDRGWQNRLGWQKRPSVSWLRKLAAQGMTTVAVGPYTRNGAPAWQADFTIAEVLRGQRRAKRAERAAVAAYNARA